MDTVIDSFGGRLSLISVGCDKAQTPFFHVVFSRGLSKRFFAILDVFGGQHGIQNRFLGGFCASCFSNAILLRFLVDFHRFFKVRTLIFMRMAYVLEGFAKYRRFQKRCEKRSILERFGEAAMIKNRRKIVFGNMSFFNIDFFTFFKDFGDLG